MPDQPSAVRPAVAIPLYKPELTAAETLSVDRTVEVLAAHALFLIGPVRLEPALRSLCQRYGKGLRYKVLDDRYFSSIAGYNSLMCSKDLYQSFAEFSHLLISQTDALAISDQLRAWCETDFAYIGAPWLVGGSAPVQPARFFGVGNGGFSLRKIDDCLRVLSDFRRIPNFVKSRSNGKAGIGAVHRLIKHEWLLAYNFKPLFPRTNEDFFWGLLVPAACSFFRVPTPEKAMAFAFEVAPRWLYELNGNQLPFGCHAWERYERDFWEEKLHFLKPPL